MINIRNIFILCSLFFLLFSINTFSQDWQTSYHPFSTGLVRAEDAVFDSKNDRYILTSLFTDSLDLGINDTLTSSGTAGIFVASLDKNYNPLWEYNIGGDGLEKNASLDLDDNGNIYLSGKLESSNCSFGNDTVLSTDGKGDHFLAKFSSNGKLLWINHLGRGKSSQNKIQMKVDNSNDIIATMNYEDSIIVTDKSKDTTIYSGPSSSRATVVVKLDSSGNIYKNAIYNIRTKGNSAATSIYGIQEHEGDYYFNGRFRDSVFFKSRHYESTNSSFDVFLLKTDNNLNDLWCRRSYGSSDDNPGSLAYDQYGNIYLSGFIRSTDFYIDSTQSLTSGIIPNNGSIDVFILKYNRNGTLQWGKSYGSSANDWSRQIVENQNILYITGYYEDDISFGDDTLNHVGGEDFFVGTFDTEGNKLRAFGLDKQGTNDESGLVLSVGPDNAVYTGGYFKSSSIGIGDTTFNLNGTQDMFLGKFYSILSATFTEEQNISCHGGADGELTVTPRFGPAPYNYEWVHEEDTLSLTDSAATGLSAGDYTVIVTDNFDSKDTISTTLTQPDSIVFDGHIEVGGISTDSLNCYGAENGDILIDPSGGTGSYDFAWSSSNGSGVALTDSNQTGLSSGDFNLEITDENGCIADTNYTIYEPDPLIFDGTQVKNIGNFQDGEINLSVSGGTGNTSDFGFYWDGPDPQLPADTTQDLTNLTYGGDYSVDVTDTNGCVFDTTVTVTDSSGIYIYFNSDDVTDVQCYGDSTGEAIVSVLESSGDLTYKWKDSTGSTLAENDSTIANYPAGKYYVDVYDNIKDTTLTDSVVIEQPQPLDLTLTSATTDTLTCYGDADGIIDLEVSGGTTPYSYDWSNDSTSQDLTKLTAGTYSVTVTDANGCITDTSKTISQPEPIEPRVSIDSEPSCYEDDNGSLISEPTGGNGGPYRFQWNDPANQTTQTADGLKSGYYKVKVEDAKKCEAEAGKYLSQPDSLSITADITDVTCFDGSDGGIQLSDVSGGTGSYDYWWSTEDGSGIEGSESNRHQSGLTNGHYSVELTDGNNCLKEKTYLVDQPTEVTINSIDHTDVTCNGGSDGEIVVQDVSGGTGSGYEYSKDAGSSWQATNTFSNLKAEDYTIQVRDDSSCTSAVDTATVNEPDAITFATATTDVNCNGGADGEISVENVTGGSGSGYEYSNDSGSTWQSSNTFSNLPAGDYNIQVRDDQSCTSDINTTTVSEPDAITFTTTTTDVTCKGGADGEISVDNVTGGSGSGYEYSNDSGSTWQSSNTFSNLPAGDYNIQVRDNQSCTSEINTATVSEPDAITFDTTITDVTCNGGSDGEITVENVTGGSGSGYEYSNDGGDSWQNINTFSNLSAGDYDIQVRDDQSCTSDAGAVTISEPDALTITDTSFTGISEAGAEDATITVVASGGTKPLYYELIKDPSASVPDTIEKDTTKGKFSVLSPGDYIVDVTDDNNCGPISTNVINIASKSSGIHDLNKEYNFSMYPNPAAQEVKISMYFEKKANLKLEFINSLGRKVKRKSYKNIQYGWNQRINVSSLSSGLYFIRIYVEDTYKGKANLLIR